MAKVVSANVPDQVSQVIEAYAVKFRLSISHVTREIIIGELSLAQIKEALSDE